MQISLEKQHKHHSFPNVGVGRHTCIIHNQLSFETCDTCFPMPEDMH